jgi:hypothetical protein
MIVCFEIFCGLYYKCFTIVMKVASTMKLQLR